MAPINIIVVENCSHENLVLVIDNWIKLYANNLAAGIKFNIFQKAEDAFIIQIDGNITSDQFCFLVNYLYYPEGDIFMGLSFAVGYTQIEKSEFVTDELFGKKLQIFIPETDREYDNVYVITQEDVIYKIDFGGKFQIVEMDLLYSEPEIEFLDDNYIDTLISPKVETPVSNDKDLSTKRLKRFKIIGSLFVILFVFFSFAHHDVPLFININSFLCWALYVWFFTDHNVLMEKPTYLGALILSILTYLYLSFLGSEYISSKPADFLHMAKYYPMTYVLVQGFLRKIYTLYYKRDPDFDKHSPEFSDRLYTIVLVFSSILIPLLIFLNK